MRRDVARDMLLPIPFGLFVPWIFGWLFGPGHGAVFRVAEPTIRALLDRGWTGEELRPYLLGVGIIFASIVYGFIFGAPLGLLLKRHWFLSWVSFVAAFLLGHLLQTLPTEF